jgi:hypothetical protein
VVASTEEIGGQYCENCHMGHIVPDDALIAAVIEGVVRGNVLDPNTAEALRRRARVLLALLDTKK